MAYVDTMAPTDLLVLGEQVVPSDLPAAAAANSAHELPTRS